MASDYQIRDVDGAKPVLWWRQDKDLQNFGDFLGALYLSKFGNRARIAGDVYRLVGSVIQQPFYEDNFRASGKPQTCTSVFWGCGLGRDGRLPGELIASSVFCGIRGHLSRTLLGLPGTTAVGDSGFTLPLIFTPSRDPGLRKNICVPHIADRTSDVDLLAMTRADMVIRPTTRRSLGALVELIDKIASASFVLTGSLHGAVVAAAYGVPFAFLDTGHLDLPFKWRDFASSLDIPTCYARNLREGEIIFDRLIRPSIGDSRNPPAALLLSGGRAGRLPGTQHRI